MILQFWLTSILLLIITIAAVILFFVKANKKHDFNSTQTSRNQLNKALYEIRLAEIESDDAQGVVRDKEKLINELQHNLLDDISDKDEAAMHKPQKWIWLPAVVVLLFGTIAMYWTIGAHQEVDNWQKTLDRYPALQAKLFSGQDARPTEQELRDLMLGLRTQLSVQTDDADGWLLYTRLSMVFKDAESALDAIKKAYQIDPESPDIRLVYIQLKMQMGDQYSLNQAKSLLQGLLTDYPNNLEAWSMSSFIALENDDFAGAIKGWEKMLTLVDANSEKADMLKGSIAYAEQQMINSGTAKSMQEPEQKVVEQQATSPKASVEAVGQAYSVEIDISEQVNIPENGFLIVYAQSVGGPPMPIAALKMDLPTFPVIIELSDANSMMEGVKLSDYPEFIVKARVSVDGNVNNKAEQWQGESAKVKAGEVDKITLQISEKR
ncbi:MAG: c-type cytochrome biogenesis protein CcmI [Psychromonas sp.]